MFQTFVTDHRLNELWRFVKAPIGVQEILFDLRLMLLQYKLKIRDPALRQMVYGAAPKRIDVGASQGFKIRVMQKGFLPKK